MIEIRLAAGAWLYDDHKPLGPAGGFGAVYEGMDTESHRIAVKKLHVSATEAAHRELDVARDLSGKSFAYVVPVLDSGQDANSESYFVVMPVADYSLDQILRKDGAFSEVGAAGVLVEILKGLDEVNHLVHRDLKPGNVLWYEGRWKIADFGIARFVEESTSAATLKEALSPHYAAPEQWRLERASAATDVYALGCIAHTLITGIPPFRGNQHELREAHLHQSAPDLPGVTPSFQTAVRMMLRKSADTRPARERLRAILHPMATTPANDLQPSAALGKLARVADVHERAEAEAAAQAAVFRSVEESRRGILSDAGAALREIAVELADRVTKAIPNSIIRRNDRELVITVGRGTIDMELAVKYHGKDSFRLSKWDVLAGTAIEVRQSQLGVRQSEPECLRSASLWFTRRESEAAEYRCLKWDTL
jgi:eukaryotic-like serine/threonine-protein kinase